MQLSQMSLLHTCILQIKYPAVQKNHMLPEIGKEHAAVLYNAQYRIRVKYILKYLHTLRRENFPGCLRTLNDVLYNEAEIQFWWSYKYMLAL